MCGKEGQSSPQGVHATEIGLTAACVHVVGAIVALKLLVWPAVTLPQQLLTKSPFFDSRLERCLCMLLSVRHMSHSLWE